MRKRLKASAEAGLSLLWLLALLCAEAAAIKATIGACTRHCLGLCLPASRSLTRSILRAGYLLPWSGATPVGPTAAGAIELAHQRIAELQLLPSVELEWLWHDSYVLAASCARRSPVRCSLHGRVVQELLGGRLGACGAAARGVRAGCRDWGGLRLHHPLAARLSRLLRRARHCSPGAKLAVRSCCDGSVDVFGRAAVLRCSHVPCVCACDCTAMQIATTSQTCRG